jgi:hypothetical protein
MSGGERTCSSRLGGPLRRPCPPHITLPLGPLFVFCRRALAYLLSDPLVKAHRVDGIHLAIALYFTKVGVYDEFMACGLVGCHVHGLCWGVTCEV